MSGEIIKFACQPGGKSVEVMQKERACDVTQARSFFIGLMLFTWKGLNNPWNNAASGADSLRRM